MLIYGRDNKYRYFTTFFYFYLFIYLFIFLNVEQIMAFALSTNLAREVKNNSPNFKQIE